MDGHETTGWLSLSLTETSTEKPEATALKPATKSFKECETFAAVAAAAATRHRRSWLLQLKRRCGPTVQCRLTQYERALWASVESLSLSKVK